MEYEKVLGFLTDKLRKVKWCIVGSLALSLKGIDVSPRDIDILTDKEGAHLTDRLLKQYRKEKVSFKKTDHGSYSFSSYYGIFELMGTRVEVMGDMRIKRGKIVFPYDMDEILDFADEVKIKNFSIKIAPLENSLIGYYLIEREEKVKRIVDYMKIHGYNYDYLKKRLEFLDPDNRKKILSYLESFK